MGLIVSRTVNVCQTEMTPMVAQGTQ